MCKIVFIGGGSAKFVREVAVDLFAYPALQDAHITLMDVNEERANRSRRLVEKIIEDLGIGATVDATTDRREALREADYVIITVMVGGYDHYHSDVAIPAKYGVYQTVSDTIGPGGVFRTVRTAPVMKGIVDDLREVAPCAWVLNYANPMAMNVTALTRCGQERVVGLCHSIQHCHNQIAKWLGLPAEEVLYTAGGINHVDFYLTLRHRGEDLYPRLLEQADRIVAEEPAERARFELLRYLGHLPAEGPFHQSEYYPWFRKNEAAVEHYAAPTFWGYNVDSEHFKKRTGEIEAQISGEMPISYERSVEYGPQIIHAMETNAPMKFYGNVPNRGLIENLPAGAVVEVPCVADATGIVPCRVGRIPAQLAAVMAPHTAVHELAVAGTLGKNKCLVRQAIQADPLTATILTLPQIEQVTDELFAENHEYVADWN